MKDDGKEPCAEHYCEITEADLPLSCPRQHERAWDAHPRIYLPIEETHREVCPYCGAVYVLKED
jgi:uncharacterized Zn-finger protein